ncbi:MAG: hypothetical protein SFZ23_01615 [Planctomycetota bacterium]|nr:hypothetical protein [Planctomycetota bacterium]
MGSARVPSTRARSGGDVARLRSAAGRAAGRAGAPERRGVTTILSMMFLVLFGSLATAMAISSRGNIRTAATHLHVVRALGAAETGLKIGERRLAEAASRFVMARSDISGDFAHSIWTGNIDAGESYTVLAPRYREAESPEPGGIVIALANEHSEDLNIVEGVGVNAPTIGGPFAVLRDAREFRTSGWLHTPAIGVEAASEDQEVRPTAYVITYAPLANGTDIRIISTGYDFGHSGNSRPITRTVMQDFRLVKRVENAIVAPSRILIGKNVSVTGDLGAKYTDVARTDGDPLIIKSDFRGIDSNLDRKLEDFYTALRGAGGPGSGDVDGDNRLRVRHPTESAVIPSGTTDYDGDGQADEAFADATSDGYVDEFDIFMTHFDRDKDGKVVLSEPLTAGTPHAGMTPEFVKSDGTPLDDDLALLVDSANPDRNRNGIHGFIDLNNNGKWDAGEAMADYDDVNSTFADQVLGYRDGVIDARDLYAKVRGTISFDVSDAAWRVAQGDYTTKLQGPVRPGEGESAREFNAGDSPTIDADSFQGSENALRAAADGGTFAAQVAANLGISESQLSTYVESGTDPSRPRYFRLDADADLDGRPDNWATAYFEKVPYNSPKFSDYYYRPVYENMTFRDVRIPLGNNGLFRNCTFIGVTHVATTTTNTHPLWTEYGKLKLDAATQRPIADAPRIVFGDEAGETSYPAMLPSTARPPEQMVLMSLARPMDKADIPANQAAATNGFDLLPDPLLIDGRRVTDTKLYSNNVRFHDSLFVGSIVSDKPSNFTQTRNKLQFTGATRFTQKHPDEPENPSKNPDAGDLAEIAKSQMMLPNYSVDVGTFNSPAEQDVRLSGAIVAGVLDVRGNASIDGALLLTFRPVHGEGPLRDVAGNPVGNPALFNSSIGYFGPEDGDEESLDPTTLPIVNGVRIVGWDTNGDGLYDVPATQSQPPGSTAVQFHGFGGIHLRFNPNMQLPDGIMVSLRTVAVAGTYREGKP